MINYLEHHIVDHCNLNCVGCSHFSPLAAPWFEEIENFRKDFESLAQKTQVRTIRLMGGEPLLHPDVGEFAQIARSLFPLSDIQVVTNGILLKKRKDELLPLFNEYDIRLCISNYGLDIDLAELVKGFKLSRIDWKEELYHIGLSEVGVDGAKTFKNCDLHQNKWYYFQNGRFYHCCIGANIDKLNQHFAKAFPEPYGKSIYMSSIEEIEQWLDKPTELCNYCDTIYRIRHEHPFAQTKQEDSEWIYQ